MGVNLLFYQTLSFTLSAFYAEVGGGLYAFVRRSIEPDLCPDDKYHVSGHGYRGRDRLDHGVDCRCDTAELAGSAVAQYPSIPYLGHWLESLSRGYFSITGVSNSQCIVFGMIMILIMLFEPLGLCGSVDLLLVPGRLPGVCRGVVHQAQWIVCPPPRQENLIEAMYA
ncbi:MAG: hypothetical protein WBY88_02685 [Desulfosarcina sp.]